MSAATQPSPAPQPHRSVPFARPHLAAPARDGRYLLLRRLGRGGMGEVWSACDSWTGELVAVKRALPTVRWAAAWARIRREAGLLARVQDPRVVRYRGLVETSNGPLLVMDCLDGETLRERLDRGPMSRVEAWTVATGLMEALEALHRVGIVHRDVKPSNVFLPRGGGVCLIDLGIAREAGSPVEDPRGGTVSQRAQRPGPVVGTPGYMAPEQARGEPADPRADIYAVGVLVAEMLTGRGPIVTSARPASPASQRFESTWGPDHTRMNDVAVTITSPPRDEVGGAPPVRPALAVVAPPIPGSSERRAESGEAVRELVEAACEALPVALARVLRGCVDPGLRQRPPGARELLEALRQAGAEAGELAAA